MEMSNSLLFRFSVIASILAGCLLLIPHVNAQSIGTKDPQAVALINSCLNASGGSQGLSSIQDFVASGTATFNWDSSTQAGATLKSRVSTNQFRFDASLPDGVRSWAVTKGAGALVDIDQTRTKFTYQTAVAQRSLSWPVLDFIVALSDPAATISYVGPVSNAQGQAYQIHIQETYPSASDPTGLLSKGSSRDYFIDPNNFLLTEIRNTQSVGGQNYVQSLRFFSYTNVNGLLVPFTVTETIGGQRTWTLQLSNISFNVGLTDTDFQL